MFSEQSIAELSRQVSDSVEFFGVQVGSLVNSITQGVADKAMSTLQADSGVIQPTVENLAAILGLEVEFYNEVSGSDFYPTIMEFVQGFVGFRPTLEALMREGGLPEVQLSDEHTELLANQVVAALGVIEGQVFRVGSELRNELSRSLGGIPMAELVSVVSEAIRKLNKVKQIAKDQLMIWLRFFGHIVHSAIENDGIALQYTYHGSVDDNTREFCAALVGSGPYSREQVTGMDNEQTPHVFVNGGGYGCGHFWLAEAP